MEQARKALLQSKPDGGSAKEQARNHAASLHIHRACVATYAELATLLQTMYAIIERGHCGSLHSFATLLQSMYAVIERGRRKTFCV